MKKFLTIVAALALVLGLSQCKKVRPDMPHYSGQVGDMYVQHVTVGASHGSSNSKVSGSQSGTALNLVWDKGDELNVYNQTKEVSLSSLKLKGKDGSAEGQFEGDITATTDDNLTFYYKGSKAFVDLNEGAVTYAASNFIGQDGTLDGDDGVFKRLLIMKENVKFPLDGSTLELSVPYAIVFLDLSSFGATTKDDVDVTIKKGEDTNPVATVKGVTTASNKMYVVMPVDNTEQTYTLDNGNGRTVKYTWTLDGNKFYTAAGTGGGAVIDCFYLQAKQANSTVSMEKNGDVTVNLEYLINGGTWQDFTIGTTTITLPNIGDKVYFRAKGVNTTFSKAYNIYVKFVAKTGDLAVSGNIMYLLNGTTPATTLDANDHKYCFSNLFNGCTAITDASELLLPATTLAESCYENMFNGCSKLTKAPALPATTLADYCYNYMFQDCHKLVTPPELNATQLYKACYYGMFLDCHELTTAPALQATTLAVQCYCNMFSGCSKLSSVTMLATNVNAQNCLKYWLSDAGTKAATTPTVTVAGGKKTTIEGTLDKSVWTVNEPTLTVTTTGITPYLVYCECSGNASCDPQQNCEVGFVYSLSNNNPTVGGTGCTTAVSSTNKDVTPTGVDFAASLDYMDMSIGTYYVKAYAKVNGGSEYIYGVTKSIQINATVTFDYISVDVGMGTDFNFATKVYSTPSQQCDYGYVISKNENPTIEQYDYRIDVGTGNVDFYDGTNISVYGYDIAEGHYYIRAYAKGENGEYKYSDQESFTSEPL